MLRGGAGKTTTGGIFAKFGTVKQWRGDGFVSINMVQFANFLKRCMKSLKNSFGNDILLWIETSRMDDGPRMRGG